MEELILRTVSECGVPTIICLFLMVRGTKSMDELTAAIRELVRHHDRIEADIARILRILDKEHR